MKQKINKMIDILTIVETINETIKDTGAGIELVMYAEAEEIKALAEQEDDHYFEPSMDIPYSWALIKLGEVYLTLRTTEQQRQFI